MAVFRNPHGKERTMRHRYTILALAIILVAGFAAHSGAVDTSPYLVSNWYTDTSEFDEYTSFFIINPTPIPLVVYAAFYTASGVFSGCVYSTIDGNDAWFLSTREIPATGPTDSGWVNGTAKFFAFPRVIGAAPKFDPNAVIGGIKQSVDCDWMYDEYYAEWGWVARVSEANMKAVTISSSTIGEFQEVLRRSCAPLGSVYITPQAYCDLLPKPQEEM
jgi:hypothetical protein